MNAILNRWFGVGPIVFFNAVCEFEVNYKLQRDLCFATFLVPTSASKHDCSLFLLNAVVKLKWHEISFPMI